MNHDQQESLVRESPDVLIRFLNKIVVFCVQVLAILMVFLIVWSVIDVIGHVYEQVAAPPVFSFNEETLIATLGGFLAVLIAIEIFLNIVFYLKRDAIHVPLVLSTALTAVARKVIVLDYKVSTPDYIYATAAIILAVGLTYWLVTKKSD